MKKFELGNFSMEAGHFFLVVISFAVIISLVGLFESNSFKIRSVKRVMQCDQSFKTAFLNAMRNSNASISAAIPPIIHQSWKNEHLPEQFLKFSKSWKDKHVDFKYLLWTDRDNDNLVRNNYAVYERFYLSLSKPIMKADLSRAFYLHQYGGVYADLDTWCLRPVNKIIQDESILFGHMSSDFTFPHNIPNAWMASSKGHPFWIFFVEVAMACFNPLAPPEEVAGPVMLKIALEKWNSLTTPIKILRPGILYIRDWHNLIPGQGIEFDRICNGDLIQEDDVESKCKGAYPDAHVITFWAHSWG